MSELDLEFAEMVESLYKPGEDIIKELTPTKAHLWHMGTGVSGEAGELLDAIKRHVVYGKPLDLKNVKEELGDLEFFMEGVRALLGITREETLIHCKNKLTVRYQTGKYSNEAAQYRLDKEQES